MTEHPIARPRSAAHTTNRPTRTAMHRCRHTNGIIDPTVTRNRMLRLMTGALRADKSLLATVLEDLGECTQCLRATLIVAASAAAQALQANEPATLMGLELELAALETKGE